MRITEIQVDPQFHRKKENTMKSVTEFFKHRAHPFGLSIAQTDWTKRPTFVLKAQSLFVQGLF